MADLSTVLGVANMGGWAYDATHDQIDIVTTDGQLKVWGVQSQQFDFTVTLGGAPGSVAASPEGRWLLVGNSQAISTGANSYAAELQRVDWQSHALTGFQIPVSGPAGLERGVAHVAVATGNLAYFTTDFAGSGTVPLRTFQLDLSTPTFSTVSAFTNISQASWLIHGDSDRYFLIEQGNNSSGPLNILDAATGSGISHTTLYDINSSGYQSGEGDISLAAGKVVDVTYNNVYVFDLSLHLTKDLSLLQSAGAAIGAKFNGGGHQLFLWRGQDQKVLVLDTQSWAQVGSLNLATATGSGFVGAPFGHMELVGGGQVLALANGSGLELIDLSARLHLTVTGDASDQTLWGAVGADSLAGGGGVDTLVGGAGQDTLSGGAGGDLFAFMRGDSTPIAGQMDIVTDWEPGDRLAFGTGVTGAYEESTAADFGAALAYANGRIASGAADYVAVGVGGDLVVFADSRGDNGQADDAVVLIGRSLADLDGSAMAGFTAPSPPPVPVPAPPPPPPPPPPISPPPVSPPPISPPPVPPPPVSPPPVSPPSTGHTQAPLEPTPALIGLTGAHGIVAGNMDAAHLADLFPAIITAADDTVIAASGSGGLGFVLSGFGFTYDQNEVLVAGSATHFTFTDVNASSARILTMDLSLPGAPVGQFEMWLAFDQTATAFQAILAANDVLGGGAGADLLRGYDGSDLVYGSGGSDTLFGGDGNDVIYAGVPAGMAGSVTAGATVLRGENGDDFIIGGAGFDDINGNKGNDTITDRQGGDDWLVGGQGNDLIFAHVGRNILYGNLGDDTLVAGAGGALNGGDLLRGGQGNDAIFGGSANEWLSGDRGNDTISGGAGADIFHTFSGAGIDRVLDFNLAEGDRVQVDVGTTWTVTQVGADTVIDMSNGDQMILVGVDKTTLTGAWIFTL